MTKAVLVAFLIIAIAAIASALGIVTHRRSLTQSAKSGVPIVTVNRGQSPVPSNWTELDIKNKFTLHLPSNMQKLEPIGDSYAFCEAHSNRDINLTVVYGSVYPPGFGKPRPFDACETPKLLLDNKDYHESEIEIDGRKGRLGIDRKFQARFINALLCFPEGGSDEVPLRVVAYCRDDRALATAQQIFNSISFKHKR